MILECPSCHARYLVQAALFAQGGRTVRCARCKHEWHETLPTTIDVYAAPQTEATHAGDTIPPTADAETPPAAETSTDWPLPEKQNQEGEASLQQLPALVKKRGRIPVFAIISGILTCLGLMVTLILARQPIVKIIPSMNYLYDNIGFHIKRSGYGLVFEEVKSELRYDGGTMWLFIDGTIHNTTGDMQFIPDIKARALGPDRHIIQSWWVEPPAATIEAEGKLPFHTQIAAPMQRTIESVYLEFYARDEKGDVDQ